LAYERATRINDHPSADLLLRRLGLCLERRGHGQSGLAIAGAMSDTPESEAAIMLAGEQVFEVCKRLERERNAALERCNKLNRRLTKAEGIIAASGIAEDRPKTGGGGLGRALANYAADQYKRERDEAIAALGWQQNLAGYYYRLMRTYKDMALGIKRDDQRKKIPNSIDSSAYEKDGVTLTATGEPSCDAERRSSKSGTQASET